MSSPSIPPASALPTLPLPTQALTLTHLFELSPTLQTLLLPLQAPIVSYTALISSIRTTLLDLAARASTDSTARSQLEDILGSHPRLGDKKVQGQSKGEQGSLQSGGEESEEQRELRRLNGVYEERFPGLRYVVFVNARPLGEVLGDMRRRIERGDVEKEWEEGIGAMCDIAGDRAGKLRVEG